MNKLFYFFTFFFIFSKNVLAAALASSSPADNAINILVNADITLTFSGTTSTQTGNIYVKKTSDDSTVDTFDASQQFMAVDMMTGNKIMTLDPSDFAMETEYYILIDSSALANYEGISDKAALNFRTADSSNPTLLSSTPSDNATDVEVSSNIVLNFSEAVDVESGNITIVDITSGGDFFEVIDVTSNLVTGSGSTQITINPTNNLKAGTDYNILIDASAFDDVGNNSYAGISSSSNLNFKTKAVQIFSDTVKTLVKNQSTASIQSMSQSLHRVNSRMNFIRPIQNNSSIQNDRIALNLNNPYANRIIDKVAAKLVNLKKEEKKWSIWSEGNLSFGRIANNNDNLGQDIHTEGLTFGIDKKISDVKTFGLAVNQSWQETQIGSNDANMDASTTSLITYASHRLSQNKYIDSAIGFGEMEIDLKRKVTEGNNKGVRDGKQIFGSINYLYEPLNQTEDKKLNYYSRLDLGYTMLDDYIESGDGDSVNYNDQNVKSSSLSFGLNFSNIIEYDRVFFTPLVQFELGKNKTINSLSEAYYVNDSSTIYSNSIADQNTSHAKLTLGIGASLENDLNINISYDHYRNDNNSFVNSFTINLRKVF